MGVKHRGWHDSIWNREYFSANLKGRGLKRGTWRVTRTLQWSSLYENHTILKLMITEMIFGKTDVAERISRSKITGYEA
jgi:hypothetical protein